MLQCHLARLRRVFELVMIANAFDFVPAILYEHLQDFA